MFNDCQMYIKMRRNL